MINGIKRVVRKLKGKCLNCGEVEPVKDHSYCNDCSLFIVKDYDDVLPGIPTDLVEKPVYHEEDL